MSRPQSPAFLALLIASLALWGCGDKQDDKKEKDEPAIPVAVATVVQGPITASYKGTTSIEAAAEATVIAKVAGLVQSISVEEGSRVTAGDILARLDDERLRLERDRSRAQLAKLSSELERSEEMFRRKLISRDEIDRKRFEHAVARAESELADLNLREAVIRAPIDGVVSSRQIKVGNMVQVQAALFHIADLERLEASLHVPERSIRELAAGQNARLTVDAWPDQTFTGRVLRIAPVVDANSGTFKVTLSLTNADDRLRPGMFGRLEIIHDEKVAALLVPKDSVELEDATASVFVVDGGKAQRRSIRLGYSDALHYEVLEGLQAGEQVVTVGRAAIKDGGAVEIVPD